MTICESGLSFIFDENDRVTKIDDSRFYRDLFEVFDGAKSADFVLVKSEEACLIEVKNFAEHFAENRNRLIPETDRDMPLDVEAFEKFFCTISCLYGIYTKKSLSEKAAE